MLFNSAIFLIFFLLVLSLYWTILKPYQLWVLVISGCVFYGSWNWKFLLLLFFTSGVDYFSAKQIAQTNNRHKAKRWLIASISINLITLCIFKYYNFFAASLVDLLSAFDLPVSFLVLNVVLPVGISFYTFQSIAYVTDVYRKATTPEHSALTYFAFICFFPQMVAGPIERAKWMFPQFKKKRTFSLLHFESGLNLMLYGFFKKVVIADNLANLVDKVHSAPEHYSWQALLLAYFGFALQIYADFSGYSDIARACAQWLGFKLSKNFYFPYFSNSFRQFWRRWHISLSSWFRDYVYIPMGGNKLSPLRNAFNLIITFVLSGLWHGANLTFIFWGFFHGLLLGIERRLKAIRMHNYVASILVFLIVTYLFTLFRTPSWQDFVSFSKGIFSFQEGLMLQAHILEGGYFFLFPLALFISLETIKYRHSGLRPFKYNYVINILLLNTILLYAVYENAPRFIYFQF